MSVDFQVSALEPVSAGLVVIVMSGEADLFGAPELKAELLQAIEAGATRLVVDMTETKFIDSTTLGVLLGASKRLRPGGGDIVLVVDDPSIRKVFEITMLDRAFELYETRAEALAALA